MKDHTFHRDKLPKTPWKNGGGITREIACSNPDEPYWRLSLADVTQDGAFSTFPGLHRVLTVVEGEGMVLKTETEEIHANPLKPVSFSGETPVMGQLKNGPVQNFNLIYDAEMFLADLIVGSDMDVSQLPADRIVISAAYCLEEISASENLKALKKHSVILNPFDDFIFKQVSSCIYLSLRHRF